MINKMDYESMAEVDLDRILINHGINEIYSTIQDREYLRQEIMDWALKEVQV